MNSKEVNAIEKARSMESVIEIVRKTNINDCNEITLFIDNRIIKSLIEFGYDVTIYPAEEKMVISWKNFKEGKNGTLEAKI